MSGRGSFTRRRRTRTFLSSVGWPLVAVGVYVGMVVFSVLAGSDGYWLGFANGAGLIAIVGVMASRSSRRPTRYTRSPVPSTASVWLPEQRTTAREQGLPHRAGRDLDAPDGSFQASS